MELSDVLISPKPHAVYHFKRAVTDNSNGGYAGYGSICPGMPLANVEAMLKAFFDLRYA